MFAVWMTGILFTLESAALVASFEAKFFPSSSLDSWLQSYHLILPVSSQGPWSSFKEPGQGYWVLTECPPCVHISHFKWICEEFHPAVSCWLVAEEGGHQRLKRKCDVVAVRGNIGCAFLVGCFSLICSPFLDHVCWPVVRMKPSIGYILCISDFMQARVVPKQWGALKELCYDLFASRMIIGPSLFGNGFCFSIFPCSCCFVGLCSI